MRETQDIPVLRERCLDVLYENLSEIWLHHLHFLFSGMTDFNPL